MNNKGFTLIELIVVIAIISILSAVVSPNAYKAIEKARTVAFVADLKAVKSGLASFYADTGRYPGHYEDIRYPLITGGGSVYTRADDTTSPLVTWRQIRGWDGPYIEKSIQLYWQGQGSMTFQNSCSDRAKDWEGSSSDGCDLFFCYQPAPPIAAQIAIDKIVDSGDGYAKGLIRGRTNNPWDTGCFWPGFYAPDIR